MTPPTYRHALSAALLLTWAYHSWGCEPKPSASSTPDAGTAAATGVRCVPDPTSGVTLCNGTSLCQDPSAQVPGDLSTCGFKTVVPSFDLECVCDGAWLCPIGVASDCAEVTTLLAKRTLTEICNQVGTGTCKDVSGGGTGTGGGPASTCDPGCEADCAGSSVCIHDVCGC